MTDTNPAASPVDELLRQREQLRGWLAKLGEVGSGAPSKVTERVRRDYEDRLRRVTEELSQYQEEIGRDLERLRGELDSAEQRRTQAAEILEEARLRHMIGELDDEEWARQEARLQGDVDTASSEAEQARAEVDRLSALASEVSGTPAEPEAPAAGPEPDAPAAGPEPEAPAAPAAEMFPEEPPAGEAEDTDVAAWLDELSAVTDEGATPEEPTAGSDLPWLEKVDEPQGWTPETEESDGLEFLTGLDQPAKPEGGESLADDDLAFLEELDRAISGSPASPRPGTPPPAAAATPPAAPAAGGDKTSGGPLLCKECGAINEPHSWYCEVCGSEL